MNAFGSLPVDGRWRDDVVDDLRLVVFADLAEHRDRLVLVPDFADDRIVSIDNLAHLGFDFLEVFRRERRLAGKVIVKAVIDHRADRDLRVGIEFLHGLRQHVRGIMPDQLKAFSVIGRHDFDPRIAVQRARQVTQFAIDTGGNRLLGQGIRDGTCDVERACTLFKLTHRSIGQGYFDHVSVFFSGLAHGARQSLVPKGLPAAVCLARVHRKSHPIQGGDYIRPAGRAWEGVYRVHET